MDIRVLHYFLVVAEEQNITRAAEKLLMAQPGLSRQMKQLEEELGTPLFIRGSRKLELTEEGLFLKERAEHILDLVERTRLEIDDMKQGMSGTVYIGVTQTIASTLLPKFIAGFKALYPEVHYDIWSGNSDEVIDRLEKGLLDFAIVREPYDQEQFDGTRIRKEPWCVLVHKDSPIAARKEDSVPLSMLAEEELIVPAIKSRRREIENWFLAKDMTANIFCEYAPLISSMYLVEQGVGAAILPESVSNTLAGKNLSLKRIADPEVYSYVAILTKKYRTLSKAANALLAYVKESSRTTS